MSHTWTDSTLPYELRKEMFLADQRARHHAVQLARELADKRARDDPEQVAWFRSACENVTWTKIEIETSPGTVKNGSPK